MDRRDLQKAYLVLRISETLRVPRKHHLQQGGTPLLFSVHVPFATSE